MLSQKSSAPPRRIWVREALFLIGAAVAVGLVFGFTPLDIELARLFFRAESPDHWPLGELWPASVLYRLAPYFTATLVIIGLSVLGAGLIRGFEGWRIRGIFLILCIVIGPGLFINAVLKDHWDRPRPREVLQFGGALHYVPAPLRGEGGGSFPCGHCSVGFLYAAGWWIWKRRRPRLARASLALGLTVGTVLGIGRMAQGAHFLSDVVWSALLAFTFAHVLHYHVLRVEEGQAASWLNRISAVGAVAALLVLTALFVTPHGAAFRSELDLEPRAPRIFELTARTADIDVEIGDFTGCRIHIQGELHGFGAPGSRLATSTDFRSTPVPTLAYRIDELGFITDLNASASVRIPLCGLSRIVVRLGKGNIRVIDETARRVVRTGAIDLDLHTGSGSVRRPDGPLDDLGRHRDTAATPGLP